MAFRVAAYQHGIYPRSEDVVAATRGLERGRVTPEEVAEAYGADREDFVSHQQRAGLDYFSDGLLRWQDLFRPLVEASQGLEARTLIRWFDNNSFFRAPEVVGELRLHSPVPAVMQDDADLPEPKMVTLPSPYLLSRAAQSDEDRNSVMRDLTREVDLVEEVARFKMEEIPFTLPKHDATFGRLTRWQRLRRLVEDVLTGCGYSEA